MNKITAWTFLGLVSSGFCVDEYLPIEKGKVEIDVGYGFGMPFGQYDSAGKKKDLPANSSPMTGSFPLQVKYGIMSGLNAELAWPGKMNNKDAGDDQGMDRPDLAVKYASPEIGAGVFLDVAFPMVTGNLDNPKPGMGIGGGAVFGKRFGNFKATALGLYQFNLENSETVKYKAGNVVSLYFKPEAMWTEFVGTYLGIKYDMTGQDETTPPVGAKVRGNDAYFLTVLPGINTLWLNSVATEINAPITVMGKRAPASWGITAQVYVTLPM